MVMVTVRRRYERVRVFLENKASLLQCLGDAAPTLGGNEDVVREICADEENRAVLQSEIGRLNIGSTETHILAKARGLVRSNTLCPASNPSPSTWIATNSSVEIETLPRKDASRESIIGRKYFVAASLEQTIEHSTGVTDMLTKSVATDDSE
jgi:hypothetical protein